MLEVRNLSAGYDGIEALRNVALRVEQGEMVALIGPNGAGKSTLLNTVSGLVRATSGEVVFGGTRITGTPPHLISRRGLLQVPEGRQILSDLTVEENLQVGKLALGGRPAKLQEPDIFALFPILGERRGQRAGDLSGGQQQMLAVGRALMANPGMLLLDEPSLGLSPLITDQVFDALRQLNASGLTILLVEQNAYRALKQTSRAYIIERGRIALEGRSDELLQDPRVAEHYLGQAPA